MDFSLGPLDPFIFSRDFDAKSPATSVSNFLSALGCRICISVLFGMLALPESLWAEASALLTPNTVWGLSLVFGAFAAATIIGGPVGVAIDALIIGYGLYELWPVIKKIADNLWEWLKTAYWANNEAELKQAGQHFADALGAGGITALEAIVLHKVFVRTTRTMIEHFPAPKWLERRFKNVEAHRRKRAADEASKEETSKRPREEIGLEERVHSAAGRVLFPAGKGVGQFPTGLVLGGTLLAVAAGTGIVLLASAGKSGR